MWVALRSCYWCSSEDGRVNLAALFDVCDRSLDIRFVATNKSKQETVRKTETTCHFDLFSEAFTYLINWSKSDNQLSELIQRLVANQLSQWKFTRFQKRANFFRTSSTSSQHQHKIQETDDWKSEHCLFSIEFLKKNMQQFVYPENFDVGKYSDLTVALNSQLLH